MLVSIILVKLCQNINFFTLVFCLFTKKQVHVICILLEQRFVYVEYCHSTNTKPGSTTASDAHDGTRPARQRAVLLSSLAIHVDAGLATRSDGPGGIVFASMGSDLIHAFGGWF